MERPDAEAASWSTSRVTNVENLMRFCCFLYESVSNNGTEWASQQPSQFRTVGSLMYNLK